jgi:hypothetical protein
VFEDDLMQSQVYSRPNNMLEAMVDLRKCQLEYGATQMSIELGDIQDGDV